MKITRQEVEQYRKDGDYIKVIRAHMNDFFRMWAEEEGFVLSPNFDVGNRNSRFFTKINSEKHAVNLVLEKMGYPIVETESLTFDMDCAILRATQLYRANGHGVIRANRMAGGGGTYIIPHEKSIKMMVSSLLHHPKGPVLPLYSPYYEAAYEYGVFLLDGEVALCIQKIRNEKTGLHNLSLGAKAQPVRDEQILGQLRSVCSGLSELFGIGFARIDIMATEKGLKIVELSAPNFKKFALQDDESMQLSKELFLRYMAAFPD